MLGIYRIQLIILILTRDFNYLGFLYELIWTKKKINYCTLISKMQINVTSRRIIKIS